VSTATVTGGTITGAGNVCKASSTTLSLSGQTTGTTLQWYSSLDSNTFTTVSGATAATYTIPSVDTTVWYRVFVTNGGCTNWSTNTFKVTTSQPAVGGTTAGDGITKCSGTGSTILTLNGYFGNIQWQSAAASVGSYSNLSGATSASYTATNLTTTTNFRALLTNGACSTFSTVTTVAVDSLSAGGTALGTTTVCTNAANATMNLSGYRGTIVWQSATLNGSFANMDPAQTAPALSVSGLLESMRYRAMVTNGVCSSATSTTATITVSPLSVGGNAYPADTTVCGNSNNVTLRVANQVGSVYQWQLSTDGGNSFSNVATGGTGATYTAPSLTATTKYRVVVTSGACAGDTSTVATVNVDPAITPGTITGDDTVCANSNNTVLTLNGSVGTIEKWQWSTSPTFTTFTDIDNSAGLTQYTAENLTTTTYYRALITGGVCSLYSGVAKVTVDSISLGGTVSGSTTICYSTGSTSISLSGYRGTIQWQSATSSSFTSPIVLNGTAASYTVTNLTETTYYRAVATNGVCPAVISTNFATINVDSPAVGGTISGGGVTVCANSNSTTLTLNGYRGTLQWQSATGAGAFADITLNGTGASYTAANLTATTRFRVKVINGTCSTPVFSDTVTVTVNAVSKGGSILGATTLCYRTDSTTLRLSGSIGTTYAWQSATLTGPFGGIMGATTDSFMARRISEPMRYRVSVKNGVCPAVFSDTVINNMDSLTRRGTISGATTVCTGTNLTTLKLNNYLGTIQWQRSVDNNSFTAAGSTLDSFVAANLTATTQYRVSVKNGVCPALFSDTSTISVDPAAIGGKITGATTVPMGSNSTQLTLTAYTGTIQKWQLSLNGVNFTDITPSDSVSITAINLNVNTYYRAVVTNGVCSSFSDTALMTVSDFSLGGTITGATTVCTGTNSTKLRLTNYRGSIQWQSATLNGTFGDIGGATKDSLVVNSLTQTTLFRARVKNGASTEVLSDTATIVVS
ncbi:MAG: beta strand repeat-containing protein, partial [Chitinophagaceae bacterium]